MCSRATTTAGRAARPRSTRRACARCWLTTSTSKGPSPATGVRPTASFRPWLDERRPDVVCLQETKVTDTAFAAALGRELAHRGYAFAHHGEAQWNGVAVLSRVGLEDVVVGLPDGPGFPHQEARAIAAVCA